MICSKPGRELELVFEFSEPSLILHQNLEIYMYIHPPFFMQIGRRRSISPSDFSTLRGVPLAGDSYWSSKRRYAAVTYLQILWAIGNKRCLFLEYKSETLHKKIENHSQPFLRPRSSCHIKYQLEPDLSRETIPLQGQDHKCSEIYMRNIGHDFKV